MAEFDKEGADLDVLRGSLNLGYSEYKSADGSKEVNTVRVDWGDTVLETESLDNQGQSEISTVLQTSTSSSECDNDILAEVVDDTADESLYDNNVRLNINNIENLKKQVPLEVELETSTDKSADDTTHKNVAVEDHHECSSILHNNYANGTAHFVPDSDPKECSRKKKGVSFPMDDALISGYLDPPDPWKNAPQWTTDELVSVYKTSCDLNGTKPIAKLISQLQAMNSDNQREELLSLKGEKLDQKQCECLEEILKRAQFKLLDFEACHLDEESAVALFDMIEFYESACQLNIAFNRNIQARGWQACSKLVRRTPNLTFLDMRNCDLNDRTIPIFGRALKLGCHLTVLHMENMSLTGRPLLILVAAVKTNEVLQELFLAENKLVPTDGVHLGNLLLYNHKLRLLDLRNNHLQDVGTGHICDGIMEQTKGCGLRTLVLWNNSITYQAMSALGRALASSQNLETLNIGHNGITNEGTHQLKEGLLRLNSLLRLGLQGSKISDEGAVAIAEYIADTKVLLRIDLRDNDIKTAGLMALSHAMRVNTSVTRIDLDKEAKKEPGIKDYVEQQGRLIGDILTFQQRNLQITVKKEEQERLLLKEKFELEMAAAQKEAENEQQACGALPANSSTESFTLIEAGPEKGADQETHTNNVHILDAHINEGKHQQEVSSEKGDYVDALDSSLPEEDKKTQHRPNELFPLLCGLSPQASLDSPAPMSNNDHFAITTSDSYYECVSPPSYSSRTNFTAVTTASAPAEMILSPQYFPKQMARKIFSVHRVKEESSSFKPSSSAGSPHPVSYDPLSVSPVPLVSVSFSDSTSPSASPVSELQPGMAQHSQCKPQPTSPSSLLLQDLAEESMRHMVSPDLDVKGSAPASSQRPLNNDSVNNDTNLDNNSSSSLDHFNSGLETAAGLETATVGLNQPESQTVSKACEAPSTFLFETESSHVSGSTSTEQSEKDSSIVSDLSIISNTGVPSLEDQAALKPKSMSTSEQTPQASETYFPSQEGGPKLAYLNNGHEASHGSDLLAQDINDTSKETPVVTKDTTDEYDPEISFDSPFFSIEDSPESCASVNVSQNEMPAFLDLGADISPHSRLASEKDELHHHHDEVCDNSQKAYPADEKHLGASVTHLYSQKEPVSLCLNNYSSPSLLVSQELSSASLQEKSVVSQFGSTSSQEHPFSSIVDLLRLDICQMSDRKDMQIDTDMPSLKVSTADTSDELVSDNIDIDNVEFGLDEEPWLSVGVEVDGSDVEASRKSLKQPDFFTTLSMNGLTQELASALTSLDGSNSPFDGQDYEIDS